MKMVLFVVAIMASLTACQVEVPTWSLKSINTGGTRWVGYADTRAQCLSMIDKARTIKLASLSSYQSSDEEEHGLGMVLVCVPDTRLIEERARPQFTLRPKPECPLKGTACG